MDPVHREVLDVNHNYLVERVCAANVLPRLVRDDIVSDDDVKQLRRTEGQGPRAVNRLMLLTLRRRGSCAYATFHRALRDAGLDDVCETLLDTELALRDGLAVDRIGVYPPHTPSMERSFITLGTDAEIPRDLEEPVTAKAESPSPSASSRYARDSESRLDPLLGSQQVPESAGTRISRSPSQHEVPESAVSPINPQEDVERDNRIKDLEQEVNKLRLSHDTMETEFKKQLEKLEQGQNGKGKSGGCLVM